MNKDNKQISTYKIDKENKENWNNRYTNPIKIIDQSNQILKSSKNISYKKGELNAKLNIAVCKFLLSEHDDKIIVELNEIIDYFEKNEHKLEYANALTLFGNVYHSYGNYEKGLKFCKKAQQILIELESNTDLADNYSVCGLIYLDLSDFESAINNFESALDLRTEAGNKPAMASSINFIARTNFLLSRYEKSLEYYFKALSLRQEIKDTNGLPWTHIGLASIYEQMNDYDTCEKHYNKALELNKKLNDKRCNLHCYVGIGSIKSKTKKLKEAENYLFKALDIAKLLNSISHLYKIHKILSDIYDKMSVVPKAYENYKLYHSYKEQVMNTELQNSLKKQEIAFAIEKAEKEAEIYRLKHIELKTAYDEVDKKNTEITDSINYAKNIQLALLPSNDYIDEILPERFILFKPKNIVSGDFYWINKIEDEIIIVAADCTGHGVPGAFMSMLGISFLNEIVNKNDITQPNFILDDLRKMIVESLNQSNKTISDGMDLALININNKTLKLEYAGAFNPLLIFRQNIETKEYELIQIKADRMPVGKYMIEKPFENNLFQLQKNDTIYMFSDGYQDQFGGEKGMKFKSKRFKELLNDIQTKTMKEQKEILNKTIIEWQGDKEEQIDDIIIIGLKI